MQPVPHMPVLQVGEARGTPVSTPYGQLTPIARAVKLRWPDGGFVWNRAVAVEVSQGQGLERVPVRDATSRMIAIIALTGVIVTVLSALFLRRRKGEKYHD